MSSQALVVLHFLEAAIFLVSTKKSRPRKEIGTWASISYSGCLLYACAETVIELESMRTIKPEAGFLVPFIFYFVQSVARRSPLTENARALGTRLMQLLFRRHAVLNGKCCVTSAKDITSPILFDRLINPPVMLNVAEKGKIHRYGIPCSKEMTENHLTRPYSSRKLGMLQTVINIYFSS